MGSTSFLGILIGTMLFTIGFIVSIYALFELLDEKRKQTALLEEIADRVWYEIKNISFPRHCGNVR